MRVVECIEVKAPPEGVWELLGDPTRYLHFMSGFTRGEVVSEDATGEGARYFDELRSRQRIVASIAGTFGLIALFAGTMLA